MAKQIITLGIGSSDGLTAFITTGLEIGEEALTPEIIINFSVKYSDIINSNVEYSDIINSDVEVGL